MIYIKNHQFDQALPDKIISATKYATVPKELQLFFSQIGVVKNTEDGNKYQKYLKPGQVLVSQKGQLWRWDGLHIRDGSKTITYKRVKSTAELIILEKELKDETSKINKLYKLKSLLDKKNNDIDLELRKITKQIKNTENIIMSNNDNLVEIPCR